MHHLGRHCMHAWHRRQARADGRRPRRSSIEHGADGHLSPDAAGAARDDRRLGAAHPHAAAPHAPRTCYSDGESTITGGDACSARRDHHGNARSTDASAPLQRRRRVRSHGMRADSVPGVGRQVIVTAGPRNMAARMRPALAGRDGAAAAACRSPSTAPAAAAGNRAPVHRANSGRRE